MVTPTQHLPPPACPAQVRGLLHAALQHQGQPCGARTAQRGSPGRACGLGKARQVAGAAIRRARAQGVQPGSRGCDRAAAAAGADGGGAAARACKG